MRDVYKIATELVDCSGPCGRKNLNPLKDFYIKRNRRGCVTVITKRARCKECTKARVAARHREVMAAKKEARQ